MLTERLRVRSDLALPVRVSGIVCLRGLAELQLEDGSYEGNYKTAVTSLAGLAFLASGSLPGSGPYSKNISLIVEWMLGVQDPNTGYITADPDGSRIHGHGYAVLFLSQVYGHHDIQVV